LRGLIRRFLPVELTYLGAVPRDEVVRQAVASGVPFVLRAPDSHAARALQAIAARLLKFEASRAAC
jgi:MinD-like ATPase involved in chromosome partitioning or flagellar assembly